MESGSEQSLCSAQLVSFDFLLNIRHNIDLLQFHNWNFKSLGFGRSCLLLNILAQVNGGLSD